MEKWTAVVIVSYLIYITLIIFIVDNSSYNIYDITEEQRSALDNPSNDPATLLNKFFVLSTVSSTYAFLGAVTSIFTILFIISVLITINEFIPFT